MRVVAGCMAVALMFTYSLLTETIQLRDVFEPLSLFVKV